MFVKFKAQTQIRAARGIVRLVQIRMKAGPVIARGNPQVLTESPAHFDPLRPLSLAVLVPLIHPQHADIPVLGDVIHDSATRQPGVIAVLLTRAQPIRLAFARSACASSRSSLYSYIASAFTRLLSTGRHATPICARFCIVFPNGCACALS